MAKPAPRRDSPHARVYHHLLDSPAWHVLPPAAKLLWLDMRRQLNSFNNGDISCAQSILRARGWTSASKLARAKFALMALGFITVTRPGGFAMGKHIPTLFRFTDVETFEIPKLKITRCSVTNDYLLHDSAQKALEAMEQATAELHKQARGRRYKSEKKQVPNRKLASPKSGAVEAIPRSRIGINGHSPASKSGLGKEGPNLLKKRASQQSSKGRAPAHLKKAPTPKSGLLT